MASLNSIFNPPDCNLCRSRETCLLSSAPNLQCTVSDMEKVVIKYRWKEYISKHAMKVYQGSEKEVVCVPQVTQLKQRQPRAIQWPSTSLNFQPESLSRIQRCFFLFLPKHTL